MKKSFVSLLTIAAITFGMVSCNSSKKQDAAISIATIWRGSYGSR